MLQEVNRIDNIINSPNSDSEGELDKYHSTMMSGSDEDQVFEDKDDDSDEMSFRQKLQQHRLRQQRQDYQFDHENDGVEEASLSSDRVLSPTSSTSSTMELVTVERWTVDNSNHNHQHDQHGQQHNTHQQHHQEPTRLDTTSTYGYHHHHHQQHHH